MWNNFQLQNRLIACRFIKGNKHTIVDHYKTIHTVCPPSTCSIFQIFSKWRRGWEDEGKNKKCSCLYKYTCSYMYTNMHTYVHTFQLCPSVPKIVAWKICTYISCSQNKDALEDIFSQDPTYLGRENTSGHFILLSHRPFYKAALTKAFTSQNTRFIP